MRTAIFLGLLYVGDAIRTISGVSTASLAYAILIVIVLAVCIVMDIGDFFEIQKR